MTAIVGNDSALVYNDNNDNITFFDNCKHSVRPLFVCFMMHFWMKNCFQL